MSSTHSARIEAARNNNGRHQQPYQLLLPGQQLDLHGCNTPARAGVEGYINQQFQVAYGATISDFLPLILTLSCNGKLGAVTGICPADSHPLFLEQYLSSSIEDEINRFSPQPVKRSSIAEIGNLAASRRGSSQLLFVLLAAILHRANFEWLAFTATPQVQRTIRKLGFDLYPITEALPLQISNTSAQDWGSYYETKPMVVAGRLNDAMNTITNHRVLKGMLSLYQPHIDVTANLISNLATHENEYHAQHCFAA
ncbi:MAG: thermostable hemolysin [Porticoccus sp.]|nr:thermostable hemolysin [Porticoccus sp.]